MTTPCRIAPLLFALVLVSTATPAQAAESYDNCAGTILVLPTTITTQGVWCLKGDLATAIASGAAITVNANNVTIDCNDFKIGGLGAGLGTQTAGILVASKLNTVIRHCNLRGFAIGINANGSGGHIVEDNRIEGSTRKGIQVIGAGSTVRRNLVTDTGGSTLVGSGTATGIWVEQGADVLDNTVAGVVPGATEGAVTGIVSKQNDGGMIIGNRIKGLAFTFTVVGIDDTSVGGVLIDGNYLLSMGHIGINCISAETHISRNVIRTFAVPLSDGCPASDNIVFPP
jgi:hypothetical protein